MTRRRLRVICAAVLCAIFGVGLFASTVSPYSYAKQFREQPNAAPSGGLVSRNNTARNAARRHYNRANRCLESPLR